MPVKEKVERDIINNILNAKKEIESIKNGNKSICADNKCLFLAFWDFDGTILKGDCSEGLHEKDKEVYKGLIEIGILSGYAKDYKGEDGLKVFQAKYEELYEMDQREAYLFSARIFEGNDVNDIENFAQKHFKEVLQKYYFSSSIRIMEKLKENGIQSNIISASADFFVKESSGTIPISPDSIYGIKMKMENGKITSVEVPPVPYGEGKKEKIIQVVDSILNTKKADRVFILAGFGNSFRTDGSFLKFIAEQRLDAGKPISVMINGGTAPVQYKGMFKEVTFDLKR